MLKDRKNRNKIVDVARKIKTSVKSLFFNPMFFENLGVLFLLIE